MNIIFKPIYLKENKGHGNARRTSFMNCDNNIIAIMDSDDISYNNRFERQLEKFAKNMNIDVVGGQITEFIDDPNNIIGKRIVPEGDNDIKNYLKKRCPMNHMTVMFRKSIITGIGGYCENFGKLEDYKLWVDVIVSGNKIHNLQEIFGKSKSR